MKRDLKIYKSNRQTNATEINGKLKVNKIKIKCKLSVVCHIWTFLTKCFRLLVYAIYLSEASSAMRHYIN